MVTNKKRCKKCRRIAYKEKKNNEQKKNKVLGGREAIKREKEKEKEKLVYALLYTSFMVSSLVPNKCTYAKLHISSGHFIFCICVSFLLSDNREDQHFFVNFTEIVECVNFFFPILLAEILSFVHHIIIFGNFVIPIGRLVNQGAAYYSCTNRKINVLNKNLEFLSNTLQELHYLT